MAVPELSVTAELAESTALAPLCGAENAMVAPLIGLPDESCKSIWSAAGNGMPVAALCGLPAATVRLAGTATVLVSEIEVAMLPALATTE